MFFQKKQDSSFSKLSSLLPEQNVNEPEQIDENFFYKHFITHFHNLFCESIIICIPHSKSIQGLVITKDIIESHCFIPSPYFCGQYMATKQKQKTIVLDKPIITTVTGYKEERTVNILDEETFCMKNKKIKLLLIDRLLEGEPPKHQHHFKHSITIPPIRNSRADLEFLNMFSENLASLHELQIAVQEFTDSYVYIKGYNRTTVERIQHMYMKTYRTILERNKLLRESCRTPSEHDQFLELVENVVMSFLHKKIWIQSLQSLFTSQDNYIDTICTAYSNVTLSQYSLRYPISEMHRSCFEEAILHFKRLESDTIMLEPYKSTFKSIAFTPLEKLAVIKSTLDLISSAVHDYVQDYGNGNCDTSVTSDEMIPLLAFVIVQSKVPRMASMIYYMQHYRLARMVEGSVYSFVITTMKSAIEFLKDDPLSLNDLHHEPNTRARSTSVTKPNSAPAAHQRFSVQHRKSQSVDLVDLIHPGEDEDEFDSGSSSSQSNHSRRNSGIIRPQIILPNPVRKSLDISNDWLIQPQPSHYRANPNMRYSQNLSCTKPIVSTTFPSLSNSTPLPMDNIIPQQYIPETPKLGRSLSASTMVKKKPPKVINIKDRISFDNTSSRPASICMDTRSLHSIEDESEELMGDFLLGLSKLDGNVVGSGSFRSS